MAVITSSNFAKALWPGVRTWYGAKYAELPTQYTGLFEKNSSQRAYEEEVGQTGFGLATIKTEGAGISWDDQSQGYVSRYTHVTYGLGFIITREMFEDLLAPEIGIRRAKALAFSQRQTKEIVGANIFNRAFNSSYVGGDGKEMCATDHPHKSGGTWRNELSVAADISEAALEQAFIDIADFRTDRGLVVAVQPRKLVVPPALKFEAERLLKTEQQPGTALNDINAMRSSGMLPEGYVVNNFLTDTDAWFILTNCPDGLKHFERRADSFDMEDEFDTENAKFKATARYSFGWTDPRGVFGSPGA